MLSKYFLLAGLASIAAARRIDHDWNYCWGRGDIKRCAVKASRSLPYDGPWFIGKAAGDRPAPLPSSTLDARDPQQNLQPEKRQFPILDPINPWPIKTTTITWLYTDYTYAPEALDTRALSTSPKEEERLVPRTPQFEIISTPLENNQIPPKGNQAMEKLAARQDVWGKNHQGPGSPDQATGKLAARQDVWGKNHQGPGDSTEKLVARQDVWGKNHQGPGDQAAEELDARDVSGYARGEMPAPFARILHQPEHQKPKTSPTGPYTLPPIGPYFWPNGGWYTKTISKHPITSSRTLTSPAPKVTSYSF
ncbi:MAG: hypothetical protein LQ342_000265 [Letrouitia transgressa]|nr:MAG: hypothetical protein LQ342_000265 [Letrouitia transgressa]